MVSGMTLAQHAVRACALAAVLGFAGLSQAAAQASQAGYEFTRKLGAEMDQCWFGSNGGDFAKYVYSPEPNAAGGPRILIVPKNAPHERPAMVIDIRMQGSKPNLNVYGPLAGSSLKNRIAKDLRRWMDGGSGCG